MVVRDMLTGLLHEVPDSYAGFSGFGYPFGQDAGADDAAPPPGSEPPPSAEPPAAPPMGPPMPMRQVGPPVGWITPALPFTGRQPRRLYMRCSVWPGQAGLVPIAATGPGMPVPPGMPVTPGMPAIATGVSTLPGRRFFRPRGPFRRPPIWRMRQPIVRRGWRR
jgi:hypothetical protein